MNDQLSTSLSNLVDKLSGWLNALIVNLPNIILAVVIFALAYFISQKINGVALKLLKKRIRQRSIRNLIANTFSIAIIAIGLFLALTVLNLDKALTSILAGAGVAGLAIGLALQGTIANTFSGIFLSVKDIMNIGDFIETNGYIGVVENITLRYIKVKEPDNNIVIIPNNMVVENPFKNYGLTQQIKVSVECGVSYDSDLESVKNVACRAIMDEFNQEDSEIEFHYLEFAGSSINFQIRFRIDAKKNLTALQTKSRAIMVIKSAFDKYNIDIPYPIRTLLMPDNYTNNNDISIATSI